MERNSSSKETSNSMKSRILITSDIYRRLSNKARQSGLTVDELAEALINKQLNLKWFIAGRGNSYSIDE